MLLTETQRGTVPAALADALESAAARSHRTGRPDPEALALLRASGLLGVGVPPSYGGSGGDAVALNRVVRALARANPSIAIIAFQHLAVSARIAEWGSPDQRAALLPRLARGEWLAASAWSEPGAGAAKRRLGCTARRQPDGRWRIDGGKSFTTGAGLADVYLVLVQTDDAAAGPDTGYGAAGQSFFLVGADNPALAPDPELDLVGMRGSATGFVTLRECVVDDADRLGPLGQAPSIIAGVRETGATLGAVSAGIAAAAVDLARTHLRTRGALTTPELRHRLVDLTTRLEVVDAMIEFTGVRASALPGLTTLHSKLYASTAAEGICADVAQLLGSTGFRTDSPVNRMLADARAVAHMGPTNDLCRDLVAMSWN
ncbi:MAG TPA: acyl-CoA dehydrogenase family protein [Pilimelia sp.]|nr:acyl-CoA dehydrogenase family protein [Pilimelia sp.]